MKSYQASFVFFVCTLVSLSVWAGNIVTYDIPKEALYTHHNDDFTVRVREIGGQWRDLYEYNVKVDLDNPQNASMVNFDMDGKVQISIKKNNGDFSRVEVRPKNLHLKPLINKNEVILNIDKPENLSVEFDGNRKNNLHLFVGAIEKNPPKQDDAGVLWFGPGVHTPPDGEKGSFKISSNTTVYIAGGALIKGKLEVFDAENVKILGRGIIDKPVQGIEIARSNNVVVDGPIILNPTFFTLVCAQSHNVIVNDIKSFSSTPWSDGIDIFSCTNVDINKVFLRTSDDSIAVYGHRHTYYGDVRDIKVSNSILWADIAHPINIGLHGSDKRPEVLEKLEFNNLDILEHDEDDRSYQGVMAITCGDNNLVKDILFKNIRVESIEEGMLFNIRTVYNEKYSHAPGRGVENIRFENIFSDVGEVNKSIISGYAKDRSVQNVSFKNVKVDGKILKESDINVGDFVKDISIQN